MENDVVKEIASDPGVLQRALAYTAGALSLVTSALMGMIWRQHNAEMLAIKASINKLIDETVQKDEFDRHRGEVRTDVQRLHERMDRMDQSAQQRHNDLMNTLLERSVERRTAPRK